MKVTPEFSSRTKNLSTSHSSLNNNDDHEPSISSEAVTYANSLAFPPIPIIGTPALTSHSTFARQCSFNSTS